MWIFVRNTDDGKIKQPNELNIWESDSFFALQFYIKSKDPIILYELACNSFSLYSISNLYTNGEAEDEWCSQAIQLWTVSISLPHKISLIQQSIQYQIEKIIYLIANSNKHFNHRINSFVDNFIWILLSRINKNNCEK